MFCFCFLRFFLVCLLNLIKHGNCSSLEYKQTNYIFVIWNSILNKTGYSHIMKNKTKFFSFFNMGTGWKKFDPSSFFQFSLKPPPKNFERKYGIPKGFNFWCFDGRIIVGGRSNPKLWGKYKKPHPRFHRFCYENPLKIDFISHIHHKYLLFSHIIRLILLYLYDFELKQWKQI